MCEDGLLLLDRANRLLTIVEKLDTSTPLLAINLLDLEHVECRVIWSSGGNYEAGRIRMTAVFEDNSGLERLTIKMPFQGYRELADALEELLRVEA
jgi:hypothetical protein